MGVDANSPAAVVWSRKLSQHTDGRNGTAVRGLSARRGCVSHQSGRVDLGPRTRRRRKAACRMSDLSGAGSVRPTGTPERSGGWAVATLLQAEERGAACCMILSYDFGG